MSDVAFAFTGDATSLQQVFEDIKNELAKTQQSVGGLASSFVTAFAAVEGAILSVRASFSWISNVTAQAARLEDLQTTFTSLMGEAEAAGSLLNDLWRDAANGAVTLEEISAAARPLTTVFGDTKTIREWAGRFADIATGADVTADQLAKVFARAMQLGKVDSRAVESLAKQGVPIYRELGAIIGASAEQVKTFASKGAISADQYAAALRRMTDEGGAYFQLSSKMSSTTAGSWGTLLETVNILAATLGKPINDAIRPLLQDLAESLQDISPKLEAMGESLAAAFSGAVEVVGPILSGLGDFISMLGGAKTAIVAAAVALLTFVGNTKAAVRQTAALQTQVGGLAAALRGLSFASVANAFKSALVSMKGSLSAVLAGMRVAWSVAWTTMATITRAAMVAVKTAIVSTGIGLIIVGIGEALGALYSWFMGNKEAAEAAAEAARQFAASLKQLDKSASKVRTREQYKDFMEQLQDRIDDLSTQREEAYAKEDWDKGEQLTGQLAKLWEMQAAYKKSLPIQIAKAEAAEREAAAIRAQREEADSLAEKIAETNTNLTKAYREQQAKIREDYLSSLDTETQIKLRLSDAGGFKTLEELQDAMDELTRRSFTEIGDDERYAKMAAAYNAIVKAQKDAAKEAAKAAKEKQKEEEKAKKEREEAQLEYDQKMAMLEAERSQDEKRIELLKREQRIVQLTAEYRKRGLENAATLAQSLVDAELAAEIAKEKKEQREKAKQQGNSRMSGTWVQDSRSAVGGGGISFIVGGGPMLTESKKHTALLREVREEIRRAKSDIRVSGNVTAVLGK